MADRFTSLAICKGSPYESQIPWTSGLTPSWTGCSASTYSDATTATELGWWAVRQRTEGYLRNWLGVLPAIIQTDALARSLDEFVRRRFGGKTTWIEGNPKDPNDRVYRNAYMMVLLDPSITVPDPAFVKQFAVGLSRATKNLRAVFPDINQRLVRKKDRTQFGWRTYSDFAREHRNPPETPEMTAALKDMKAKYSDIYGPNLVTESNKWWHAAQGIVNLNPMGCPYQEADGRQGCSIADMPFKADDLYFLSYDFRIYPSEKMTRFLDLWAPGWSVGLPPAALEDIKKSVASIKFDFGGSKKAAPKTKGGKVEAPKTSKVEAPKTSKAGLGLGLGIAAGAVGVAAIGYLALRGRT